MAEMSDELGQKTLKVLLAEEKAKRGLSDRALAEQIGVAHTTIARVWDERPLDIVTIRKIADYLGSDASTLLAHRGFGTNDLAQKMAAVLEKEPQLAKVFGEAMDRVLAGKMSAEAFRELAAYAAYRFTLMNGGIEGSNVGEHHSPEGER